MSRCAVFLIAATLAVVANARAQQEPRPIDAEVRRSTVEKVGAMLAEGYVFAEVGKECEGLLKEQFAAGTYDGHNDAAAFAEALTEDLQVLTKDKHLRVRVRGPVEPNPRGKVSRETQRRRRLHGAMQRNFGFHRLEILEGNIGYLDLRAFVPAEDAGDTATAAMAFLQNADAIVIDLRNNGGGSPTMVQLLSSYFFERRTHLNSMSFRGRDQIDQYWTLPHVPGKRRPYVPLYVLTSNRTFSAAEEFTYNLKNLERATIVGEVTGGGAHPGGLQPVNDVFEVWIPRGRAINPVSDTNWEGAGVHPDVAVPADQALEAACEKARKRIKFIENTTQRRW